MACCGPQHAIFVLKNFSGLVVHSNVLFVGVKQQVSGFRGREYEP